MDDEWIPSGDGSGLPGPEGHPGVLFCGSCREEAWFNALVAFDDDGTLSSIAGLQCSSCEAGLLIDAKWGPAEP